MKKFLLKVFATALILSNVTLFSGIGSAYAAHAGHGNVRHVEYKCSRCGQAVMRGPEQGRPEPGRCPRNGYRRHSWTVNRKIYHAGAVRKQKYRIVEYQCKFCGIKKTMGVGNGKPGPGRCQRRHAWRPHSWVVNRKW